MEASLDTEIAKDLAGNSETTEDNSQASQRHESAEPPDTETVQFSAGNSQEATEENSQVSQHPESMEAPPETEFAIDLAEISQEATEANSQGSRRPESTEAPPDTEIAKDPAWETAGPESTEAPPGTEIAVDVAGNSQGVATANCQGHGRPLAFSSLKGRLQDLEKSFNRSRRASADLSTDRLKDLDKSFTKSSGSTDVPKAHEEGLVDHAGALDDAIEERWRRESWPKEHQQVLTDALERRFASLEALIGDNADKHAKEIDVAKDKLADLQKVLQDKLDIDTAWRSVLGDLGNTRLDSANPDQHASVKNRTDILKKSMAESAGKRNRQIDGEKKQDKETFSDASMIERDADARTEKIEVAMDSFKDMARTLFDGAKFDQLGSVEGRMDSLEKLVAEKIEVALDNFKDMAKAVLDGTKFDQLGSVVERMDSLEKLVTESITKRIELLEALIAANAEKCSEVIEVAKGKLGDFDKAIVDCVKSGQLASLDMRMKSFETLMAETSDKLQLVKIRLEPLEKLMLDKADKHDSHSTTSHRPSLSKTKRNASEDFPGESETVVPDGVTHGAEVFDLTAADEEDSDMRGGS